MAEGITFTSTAATNEITFNSASDTFTSVTFEGTVAEAPQGPPGETGPAGQAGANGVGVPISGTPGQYLMKVSSTNYDTQWSTLSKSSVGLDNVDNTSDANKPVSTATQTALDAKPSIAGELAGENSTAANPKLKNVMRVYNIRDYGAVGDGSTDDTAAVNAAISAASTAGGGRVFVPPSTSPYLCTGAIVFPMAGTYAKPTQKPIEIYGAGPNWNGAWTGTYVNGGSVLDLRYSGGDGLHPAKIDTRGLGSLKIHDLTLVSGGTDDLPFGFCSNTTLFISRVAYQGNPNKTGKSCVQDAWILGGICNGTVSQSGSTVTGTGTAFTADLVGSILKFNGQPGTTASTITAVNVVGQTLTVATSQTISSTAYGFDPANTALSPFQGYGSRFTDNYYSRIRRAITFSNYTNNITVENETFSTSCGDNDTLGAPYWFTPSFSSVGGNTIRGCTIEVPNYVYGVTFTGTGATLSNYIDYIGMYDDNGYTLGGVYCGANASYNLVQAGWINSSLGVNYLAGPGATHNSIVSAGRFAITNFSQGMKAFNVITKTLTTADPDLLPLGTNMTIDTGTGGSHLNINAFDVVFRDRSATTTYAKVLSNTTGRGAIVLGADTTANRPSAVSVGAGAIWYDTTLGVPVISDGAGWTIMPNNTLSNINQPYLSLKTTQSGTQEYKWIGGFQSATSISLVDVTNSNAQRLVLDASGHIGLGVTVPTATLHLKASTTSAGSAPLKLATGTLMTTPEAGAIEFDGSHYYGTIGTTRYSLDQNLQPATVVIAQQSLSVKANVYTTGTSDQIAINTALAAAAPSGSKRIVVKLVGAFSISDAIIVPSRIILDAREATITLAASSGNKNMLVNTNITANRQVTNVTTTSGSKNFSGASLALTSADVGSTIRLDGAGLAGGSLVTTIASVTSGTAGTLTDAATTSIATNTATIYRRDSNIEVFGGTWDRGTNTGSDSTLSHSIYFRHIDGLYIHDLKVTTGAAKYAINPGDCTNTVVRNIDLSTYSDGIHFNGPCKNVTVDNVTGTTGDDMVAFTCSDYTAFNDVNGGMTNITVRNIYPNASLCALKTAGANGELISGLVVDTIQGTTSQSGIRFWNDSTIGDLQMAQVQIRNINLKPSVLTGTTYEMLQCNVKELADISISGCTYDTTGITADFRGSRMFFFSHPYSGATNAHMTAVNITNCHMVTDATASFFLLESNLSIDDLNFTACRAKSSGTMTFLGQIGTPAGTVTNTYYSNCEQLSGGVTTAFDTSKTDSAIVHTTGTETIAGAKTVTSQFTISNTAPKHKWNETDGGADAKGWDVLVDAGRMNWRVVNDADSSANTWLYVDRSGATATGVNIQPNLFVASTARVNVSSGDALYLNGTGTNNTILRFADDGTERGTIFVNNGAQDMNVRAWQAVKLVTNNGTTPVTYQFDANVTIPNASNVVLGTSTGTKIGTATNQKLGFFNATPIVQPSGDILSALSNLGLVTSPTLGTAWQTYAVTQTGFVSGSEPAGGIYRYRTIGDEIELEIRQPNDGTSNATTFTITLPVTAATVTDMVWQAMCRVRNNSSFVANPGYGEIVSGGTVLNLYINTGTTTWGTANGKRVDYIRIRYRWQ